MAETNEAEVLLKVFHGARHAAAVHPAQDLSVLDRDGVLAVAAKARELDAARGGTLSAEDVSAKRELAQRLWDVANAHCPNDDERTVDAGLAAVDSLLNHAAAQGRAIAALEEQVRTLTAERDRAHMVLKEAASAIGFGGHPDSMVTFAATLRARVAELEVLAESQRTQKCESYREAHALEVRAVAAESALATLRQAATQARDSIREATGSAQSVPLTGEECRLLYVAQTVLADALASTPVPEHPDTATLRRVRSYVERMTCRCETYADGAKMTCHRCMLVAALGDPGPSGGGETFSAPLVTEHPQYSGRIHLTEPTTPPDAGENDQREKFGFLEVATDAELATAAGLAERLPGATPTPTPEEDWRTLTALLEACGTDDQKSALARLRDEPRRAAERMRDRCAKKAEKASAACRGAAPIKASVALHDLPSAIRALSLE